MVPHTSPTPTTTEASAHRPIFYPFSAAQTQIPFTPVDHFLCYNYHYNLLPTLQCPRMQYELEPINTAHYHHYHRNWGRYNTRSAPASNGGRGGIKSGNWRRGGRKGSDGRNVRQQWVPKKASIGNEEEKNVFGLDDSTTTVMIKNIPNRISRRELVTELERHCRQENKKAAAQSSHHCRSEFDFVYLPFDFCQRLNFGYGFVNFTNAKAAWRLFTSWNGVRWGRKTREITRAKIQGKDALKKWFQNTRFHCHTNAYLPVEFSPPCDGSSSDNLPSLIGKRFWMQRNLPPRAYRT